MKENFNKRAKRTAVSEGLSDSDGHILIIAKLPKIKPVLHYYYIKLLDQYLKTIANFQVKHGQL